MKNNKKGNLGKRIFRNVVYGAASLALLAGSYKAISYTTDKNFLKARDFNNSSWIEIYNPKGQIWESYANENIPKNQLNWHLYIEKVREKNNGNLEGRIFLPDLDGNGTVQSH